MRINITAGKFLNKILESKYENESFIPFNEAMIEGRYESDLFSPEFLEERAKTHGVTLESYVENMRPFLDLIDRLHEYGEAVLWFGDEPFCRENKKAVLKTLESRGYNGKITIHTVIEETGEIIKTE